MSSATYFAPNRSSEGGAATAAATCHFQLSRSGSSCRYTTGEAWNTAMHELFLSPAAGDGTDMPVGTSCVESPTYEEMSNAWEAMVSNQLAVSAGGGGAFLSRSRPEGEVSFLRPLGRPCSLDRAC